MSQRETDMLVRFWKKASVALRCGVDQVMSR